MDPCPRDELGVSANGIESSASTNIIGVPAIVACASVLFFSFRLRFL
jgi:hypothetical protein